MLPKRPIRSLEILNLRGLDFPEAFKTLTMRPVYSRCSKFFFILPAILFPIFLHAQTVDTLQQIMHERQNNQAAERSSYLILISLDGFRADYAKRDHAQNILRLSSKGVQAEKMISSYPSKTFPNHYSIVTGLYPAHHGIVDNSFYDPAKGKAYSLGNKKEVGDGSWYGGTPLWVLAEKQKMLTASYYWVGSEADIQHTRPTYYYNYSEGSPISFRIQQVINWLKLPGEKRPHLITFYLPEVDHAGHSFGPDDPRTTNQVHFVDSAIALMTRRIDSLHLPVNYIIVSDHGMIKTDREHPIIVDRDSLGLQQAKVFGGETQLNLYFEDKPGIQSAYDHLKKIADRFDVYLKKDVPAYFHYGADDDRFNRIGDIVLIAHAPSVFGFKDRLGPIGTHGFDPRIKEMGAIFYAWGPAFKRGLKIPPFQNVDVYPLAIKILGLSNTEKVDGKLSDLQYILK